MIDGTDTPPQAQALRIFGLAASFDDTERLLAACRAIRECGVKKFEAYTPFPVEGLSEAMGYKKSLVPLISLVCAAAGGVGIFATMWFASVIHYHLNVGGKPPNSWPAFIPITFELSVLGAAFGAMALSKLPQPFHPLFDVAAFRRASRDRYFVCVEAADPLFDRAGTRELLAGLRPIAITEVPLR